MPDAGHARLIELSQADPAMRAVPLTSDITDELGVRDFSARIRGTATTIFARIAISAEEPPRVLPPRDGVLLKNRFRRAIGADT